ncbi:MAG: TrkA family potassium uptake protein [Buchananella hordeovulneris]|nr:TrkA family potassium uptake protein [Buchananella hordeovulneris]
MRAVIAGAGSVGRTIAADLVKGGHEVTLVENRPGKMKISTVPSAEWVLGDACSPDALEEAGASNCDVLVAATGDDKANLVISYLAKTEFGVQRVVARVNEPRNEWLFDSSWGVDVPVSTPRIMTSIVEEAVSDGELVRLGATPSGAQVYQGTLLPGCLSEGKRLIELELPADVIVAAVVQDGRPVPALADQVLTGGDSLLLVVGTGALANASLDAVAALRRLLRPAAE